MTAGRKGFGIAGPLALLVLASCTSVQYQAEHLDQQVDRARREEIALFFGQPQEARAIEGGGEEWIYRYVYSTAGGTGVVGRRTCWENVLTFDAEGVLRQHARRACKNGP